MSDLETLDLNATITLGDSLQRVQGTIIDFQLEGRRSPQERNLSEVLKAVQSVPLLAGISQPDLAEAISAGDLLLLEPKADTLLTSTRRALLLYEGQLALSIFSTPVLEREQRAQGQFARGEGDPDKWRNLHGPLIRLADRHLAWFVQGEVIDSDALAITIRERISTDQAAALFTTTPARLLSLSLTRAALWQCQPDFQRRFQAALQTASARVTQVVGARAEIIDTYLREGYSIASTLRVIDLDRCTFCRDCETACQQRYGQPRMSVNGVSLGSLLFAEACRTCTHQRCVSACGDDAIRFDARLHEVLIDPVKCTGCSLCESACPYHAITMYPAKDLLPLALLKKRPAQHPRVASKCDHCKGHHSGQQACIQACTKGALLELTPASILQQRPQALAAPGAPVRSAALLWLPLTTLVCAALLALWVSRGFSADRASNEYYLGLSLGVVGTVLLLASGAYALFNRLLRRWPTGWLRWAVASLSTHGWSGGLGALLILGHSRICGHGLFGWQGVIASCAFWFLLAVVILGLGARYFATGIVGLAARARLQEREVSEELSKLRGAPDDEERLESLIKGLRVQYDAADAPGKALRTLLADEVLRLGRVPHLYRQLGWLSEPRRRLHVARLLARRVYLLRCSMLLPRLAPLFTGLRMLHIPLAVLMGAFSVIHVILYFSNFGW